MRKVYTKRADRTRRAEVNATTGAIRQMLEGFIRGEREGAIARLNAIRPKDVIESVLGRALTLEECNLYLSVPDDLPPKIQEAFRIGQIWQDLGQASRTFYRGRSLESKGVIADRFRSFLQMLESKEVGHMR